MTRLTVLFLLAALVVPGAASAMPAPDRSDGARTAINAPGTDVTEQARVAAVERAEAMGRYYASYGEPTPIQASAPAPEPVATGQDGPSWLGALGIGLGLMLLAGGVGVYAGRSVRLHRAGA